MENIRLGLTYADVLLVPKRTPLNSRTEADVRSRFTKNVMLNVPLVSSNMASVTEHKMAIAMAKEGGLGIIHQFGTIEEQSDEVRKVKKATSYIIENPACASPHITVAESLELMGFLGVTSLLIVDEGKLVGIFTKRDYKLLEDTSRLVSEVMTGKNKLVTAEQDIDLKTAEKILYENRIEKLPLVEDGHLRGLITVQDLTKRSRWQNALRDKKGRLLVGAAVGVKDSIERGSALVKAGVDVLVLDIAHCHSDLAINKLKELKAELDIDVMAGNIATPEAARDLIEAGADGLKVGIGPSPVCSTRIISGSGMPQLTAIQDVVKVARQFDVPVSADGGARYPGDVAKAIAAGASSVYSGSFFAGTDEAPGFIITQDGKKYKRYMGSASYQSNHERKENLSGKKVKKKMNVFVEGISTLVDYKGPVVDVIHSIEKGLRSGISYCGARDIKEMQNNAEFVRITSSGWTESTTRGNKISE